MIPHVASEHVWFSAKYPKDCTVARVLSALVREAIEHIKVTYTHWRGNV